MEVVENADYTRDYLDPAKRSIGNAVQVFFRRRHGDASASPSSIPSAIAAGARKACPLLLAKFEQAVEDHLPAEQAKTLFACCYEQARLEATPVQEFMGMLALPVTS